jgi:hypothetical protein
MVFYDFTSLGLYKVGMSEFNIFKYNLIAILN